MNSYFIFSFSPKNLFSKNIFKVTSFSIGNLPPQSQEYIFNKSINKYIKIVNNIYYCINILALDEPFKSNKQLMT